MKPILLVLTLVFSAWGNAGQQIGTVNDVTVRASDGLIYFHLQGEAATGRPDCASKYSYWMIKDENSETGKKLFSMLLAAKLSKAKITVRGTNKCTRWGDGEDVYAIQML